MLCLYLIPLNDELWFRIFMYSRAVGRSKNPGMPVLFGTHNLHSLVEIGLTDLTPLVQEVTYYTLIKLTL